MPPSPAMSRPETPTTLPLEASNKNPFFRPKLTPSNSTSTSGGSSSSTPLHASMTPPDYTLPISTLLREGTKVAHVQAEHSPGALALASGTLPLKEYLRYLVVLWVVYSVLERELDSMVQSDLNFDGRKREEADAVMEIWREKGEMLSRKSGLQEDIEFFTRKIFGESAVEEFKADQQWEMDIEHQEGKQQWSPPSSTCRCITCAANVPRPQFAVAPYLRHLFAPDPPEDLQAFTRHIKSLSDKSPALLLSHAYVRYLGDLSGGQLVAAKIKRLYDLKPVATRRGGEQTGVEFYEFDLDLGLEGHGGAEQDTAHERKLKVEAIKHWFRDTMDANVADESLKARLVDEAITSFRLSTRLFFLLQPNEQDPSSAARTDAKEPATIASTSSGVLPHTQTPNGSKVIHDGPDVTQERAPTDSAPLVPLGHYIAGILALCLAYVVLKAFGSRF